MKKTILAVALLSIAATSALAQETKSQSVSNSNAGVIVSTPTTVSTISEGLPSTTTIRTGNKPQKGYFGMYMGVTSNAIAGWADKDVTMQALPIINLKYMTSDYFEVRLGLEAWRKSQRFSGDIDGISKDNNRSYTQGKGAFLCYPGVAYHFSKSNIFDVYVGGELPIGVVSGDYKIGDKNYEYNTKTTTGPSSVTVKSNRFQVGLGAFIGFQCFIANLPLALGLEYGLSCNTQFGDKLKTTVSDGKGHETTTYTTAQDGGTFSELSASKTNIGNQLRLTLSYYFK